MTFNRFLHFVILAAVVGLAYGCAVEHVRPVIAYAVYGLAIGLGGTFIVRLFVG